jgi:hypothetical protein
MHNFPRQQLCELVNHYGAKVYENADHCEFLLQERCGNDYKLEIFVLVDAIKEGVIKKLLNIPKSSSQETLFAKLTRRLHKDSLRFLGLDKETAKWAVQSWGIALSQLPKPKTTKQPKRLSYLNPLDHLRLLWWVLMSPQQLQVYRQTFGESDEKHVGRWLVSTLTWWPLLVPILALGFELLLPSANNWPSEGYWWFSLLLVGGWIVTGKIGNEGEESMIGNLPFGIVFGVVFGVTYIAAIILAIITGGTTHLIHSMVSNMNFDIVFSIAYIIAFYIAYVIAVSAAYMMKDTIKNSLMTATPFLSARLAFLALIAAHFLLIWIFFLNGWQILIS